ncbi:hypothetical protein [Streptomyces virginiae]|uniref:hypothetical protein n=1 Tax=Streptomyces virginiae TaxID=1961 RepID=UPI003333719D
MDELARRPGSSGQVETGAVPEVAMLGNMLLSLFNTLGVSQSAYAYRVHLDKSAVSRYLSGRRLAPQDFIDRLIGEVEAHCGSPITEEAQLAIRAQHLSALKAVNPGRYELEALREELSRSNRTIRRARREIDALHTLLDSKEDEIRAAKSEMAELVRDWSRERTERPLTQSSKKQLADATHSLMEEIRELREDLLAAQRNYREAEQRNVQLKQQVRDLEEELAQSTENASSREIPVSALLGELREFIKINKFEEMSRELTEAAWGRPFSDVVEIYEWCRQHTVPTTQFRFSSDIARFRPLDEVVLFGERVRDSSLPEVRQFAASLIPRLTPASLSATCKAWQYIGTRSPASSMADVLLAAAVQAHPPYGFQEVVRDVKAVSDEVPFTPVKETSSAICRIALRHENWIRTLLPVMRIGWRELSSQILGEAALMGSDFTEFLRQLDSADLTYIIQFSSDVTNRVVDYYTPTSPVVPLGSLVAEAVCDDNEPDAEIIASLCHEIRKAGWIDTLKASASRALQIEIAKTDY